MKERFESADTTSQGLGQNFYKNAAGSAHNLGSKAREQISFFTPFRDWADFAFTLTLPVTAPLLLGVLAAVTAAIAALAALLCIVSFAVAIAAALFSEDVSMFALVIGVGSAAAAVVATFVAPILAISALFVAPLALVNFFTRAGSTIGSAISDVFTSSEEEQLPVPACN